MMKIRVLGSAAGGGFPQWNCNCRQCAGVRAGTLRASARTQSSIAVAGSDAASWVLVNASPDIRTQLEANAAALQPTRAARDTAIVAIVLVDAQIDHTVGLYMLRESGRPWTLYCTDRVRDDLSRGNPLLSVLSHYCGVEPLRIAADGESFRIEGAAGVLWEALPVASKPPPFSPNRAVPRPEDNIALLLSDDSSGGSLLYAPGLGAMDNLLWRGMQAADCVLVDGTFFTDDEMIGVGVSNKRARSIGHLPQSGPGGMLEWLDRLPARTRKILIHINNTNPILDEDSAARAELRARGVEVAFDGMEIEL
jgi:pyrroloquinoline quinone biosynthesis protein B